MDDDPIAAAIKHIPSNQFTLEGGASKDDGANAKAAFERDFKDTSVGIEAEIAQKKGWSFDWFVKKVWK